MKKFFAILLVLAMVLPMCFVVQAEGTSTQVKPFYLVNWQDDITDYDNIYMLLDLNASYKNGVLTLSVNLQGQRSSEIPKIAQIIKEEFDARPEGARYINFPLAIDTVVKPEYMIYLDEGVRLFKEWNEEFFNEYKRIGGKLDGVVIDVEYSEIGSYYINKAYESGYAEKDEEEGQEVVMSKDAMIYENIVKHPLYATKVRPQLEERGFEFSEPNGNKSEIFGISVRGSRNANIWDAVMKNRMCDYINEACAPIYETYPDVSVSNYRFPSSKEWQESIGQTGGFSVGGNTNYAGNTANENFYLRRPYNAFHTNETGFTKPMFYNEAVYEDSPFNSLLFEINTFKDMYESSDNKRTSAWVAGFNYNSSANTPNGIRLTPYYSEAIYHLGLTVSESFFGYICGPRDTDLDGYDYEDNMKVFSELLNELTRVAGTADRKPLPMPTTWNSSFVLSGIYTGGKNVWRLTPDRVDGTTLESFKIKDADPTFKICGQTITFPQGKIIQDGKVSHIGTYGYWIETPADVTPIVTNDADRYRKYPGFVEDYEAYEAGKDYIYNSVEFPGSWLFKKGKNAKLVVETEQGNDGNKVLAVTGNITLRNSRAPKNITAGDTYAKDQAWEITVTLPAGLGAESKVTMLSIHTDSEQPIAGGFQFKGGKLYYANADKYVEFEGLDVSAGGKFTLKRDMDFHNAEAITCDYTVYDAAGNELASVKDIPMSTNVKLPIQGIGLSTDDVTGTVYLDDYKLYASGIATDFKLYDAVTGMSLDDMQTARSKATAYRLSWLNGTASEKTYTVVAAYYNGDQLVEEKVIKEVKMAPGSDWVEKGIVDVAEGQSVRVYLRNDNADEGPTNKPGKSFSTLELVITIVSCVVILLAILVAVIVFVNIKKDLAAAKEKSAKEESEDESAE